VRCCNEYSIVIYMTYMTVQKCIYALLVISVLFIYSIHTHTQVSLRRGEVTKVKLKNYF